MKIEDFDMLFLFFVNFRNLKYGFLCENKIIMAHSLLKLLIAHYIIRNSTI